MESVKTARKYPQFKALVTTDSRRFLGPNAYTTSRHAPICGAKAGVVGRLVGCTGRKMQYTAQHYLDWNRRPSSVHTKEHDN